MKFGQGNGYTGLTTKDETLETIVRNLSFILTVSLHSRFHATVNLFVSLTNHYKPLNYYI